MITTANISQWCDVYIGYSQYSTKWWFLLETWNPCRNSRVSLHAAEYDLSKQHSMIIMFHSAIRHVRTFCSDWRKWSLYQFLLKFYISRCYVTWYFLLRMSRNELMLEHIWRFWMCIPVIIIIIRISQVYSSGNTPVANHRWWDKFVQDITSHIYIQILCTSYYLLLVGYQDVSIVMLHSSQSTGCWKTAVGCHILVWCEKWPRRGEVWGEANSQPLGLKFDKQLATWYTYAVLVLTADVRRG